MERDIFIIIVFCLVTEQMNTLRKSDKIKHGGFTRALSDEEVITIEICGEFFKHSTDKDLFDYFKAHYQDWFSNLKDRTLFFRQAADLWQFKALIEQQIVPSVEQFFCSAASDRHRSCGSLQMGLENPRQMFQIHCRFR